MVFMTKLPGYDAQLNVPKIAHKNNLYNITICFNLIYGIIIYFSIADPFML